MKPYVDCDTIYNEVEHVNSVLYVNHEFEKYLEEYNSVRATIAVAKVYPSMAFERLHRIEKILSCLMHYKNLEYYVLPLKDFYEFINGREVMRR